MYHLPMQRPRQNPGKNPGQKPKPIRARRNVGIWLAWAVALGFHAMILWLPFRGEEPVAENASKLIELQLTNFSTSRVPPVTRQIVEQPPVEPLPEEPLPEEPLPEEQPEVTPDVTEPPLLTSIPLAREMPPDLENVGELERSQLTSAILMRQFITKESEPDWVFDEQIEQDNTEGQKDFHYPVRQSMISMLDKPLPEIPFAYEEGLIYFAYDPGVKGDIQRFWDVITPEFGWRTKYGTEVKCKWLLVIAACGWK